MTNQSDFTDEELTWIANINQRRGVFPPDEVEARLVNNGVADRTDKGLKITGLGKLVLDEAQINKRHFAVVKTATRNFT